jgi:hypothetical protein
MQDFHDDKCLIPKPVNNSVAISSGDQVAQTGIVKTATELWEFGEKDAKAFDVRQQSIGSFGVPGAEIGIIAAQAGRCLS